jgi:hypothetical protein
MGPSWGATVQSNAATIATSKVSNPGRGSQAPIESARKFFSESVAVGQVPEAGMI